jgi:hypothetical protein
VKNRVQVHRGIRRDHAIHLRHDHQAVGRQQGIGKRRISAARRANDLARVVDLHEPTRRRDVARGLAVVADTQETKGADGRQVMTPGVNWDRAQEVSDDNGTTFR